MLLRLNAKETFGNMTDKWMENIYQDQGGRYIDVPGFQCSSFYTPEGIRRIDSDFCHRIIAYGEGKSYTKYYYSYKDCARLKQPPTREIDRIWNDTYESISKDIKENPHLHPEIKKNLMSNLRRVKKELQNENKTR